MEGHKHAHPSPRYWGEGLGVGGSSSGSGHSKNGVDFFDSLTEQEKSGFDIPESARTALEAPPITGETFEQVLERLWGPPVVGPNRGVFRRAFEEWPRGFSSCVDVANRYATSNPAGYLFRMIENGDHRRLDEVSDLLRL